MDNPYLGIFPTKAQHHEIIAKIIAKYPRHNDLLDVLDEHYDLAIYYYAIKDEDPEAFEYILNLYKELDFIPTQIYQDYFDSMVNFANFDNFKYEIHNFWLPKNKIKKLPKKEKKEYLEKSEKLKLFPEVFEAGSMFINKEDNIKINKFLETQGISKYYIDGNILKKKSPRDFSPGTSGLHIINPSNLGWNTGDLYQALSKSGIFDTKVEETPIEVLTISDYEIRRAQIPRVRTIGRPSPGRSPSSPPKELEYTPRKLYKHIYPNLAKYGIPNEYLHASKIPGYDTINLPRYILENLYRRVFTSSFQIGPIILPTDWKVLCQNPLVDTNTLFYTYQRVTGEPLRLKNRNYICNKIQKEGNYL